MIANLTTVKRFLQITSTTNDLLILDLMPVVQRQIIDYCNNRFLDKNVYLVSSGISFTNPITITDSESGFVDAHFYGGMDILVSGSYNNNGFYEVDSVAAGTLTLDSRESLVTEDEDVAVTIYKVDFPKSLQMTFAKMINYNLQKNAITGVQSQRLADYSVTYANVGGADYPESIVSGLKPFKRLKWE